MTAPASPTGRRAGPGGQGTLPLRALQVFYLATPLFALLDLGFGLDLRTTFLEQGPGLKLLYYAIAFGCGIAATRWPGRAALIGLLESGTNIAWLVIGIGLRYLGAVDAALADDATLAPLFTGAEMINLVVSAVILMISYIAAQARFARSTR